MGSLIERLRAFAVHRVQSAAGVFGYRCAGDGAPLVLLHGIGSGSGSWVQQLEGLADARQVVAWDAPGYGESTPLARAEPLARDYADALGRFLEALAIERCDLVGHSLGALMATAFARLEPGRVRSLTLADPALGYARAAPGERGEKLAARLAAMSRLGPVGLARERAPALLSAKAPEQAVELVRWNMSRLHPEGHAQAARMLANADLLADAAACTMPALVMCGSADRVTPEAQAREVAAAFANARYEPLPGAGHASYVEAPALFNRQLAGFIGELP